MSVDAIIGIAVGATAVGIAAGYWLPSHGRPAAREKPVPVRRILLPFTGPEISRRAFEAAVRLAKAENAMLMPALLAAVPRTLPLDSPLPAQCNFAMPLLEAIEQGAEAQGVSVDSRIVEGRTYRDALRRLLDEESFDRIIVSASNGRRNGLSAVDLEWLLERVPAEVLILRPAPEDTRRITAAELAGHF